MYTLDVGFLDKLKGNKSSGKRILVCVDKSVLGKEATRILKRPGITHEKVRSLSQIMDRATTEPLPALAILQVTNPEDPSLGACQQISTAEVGAPVVMLYPQQDLTLRDLALEAGAVDVLPFNPPEALVESVVLRLAGLKTRKHPRVPVAFSVRISDRGIDGQAYAENLSVGGIQIRGDREWGLGRPVRLELKWKGEPLVVWGIGNGAIRVRKAVVTGIRFVGLSSVELARLQAFLAARDGVAVEDPYEALAVSARLDVADVIRLASGVDASASKDLRLAALRFTNAERMALTGMGGEASDAEPLIGMAVARLKTIHFTQELSGFDVSSKEAREYAERIARVVIQEFTHAHRLFTNFAMHRFPDATPKLQADLRKILDSSRSTAADLGRILDGLNPELALQLRQDLEVQSDS